MADEPEEGRQQQPRRRAGIDARTIKAMLTHRHLGQHAGDWAKATLRAAGLPVEVGFYSPGSDGGLVCARDDLTTNEQDVIVASGGTALISWREFRKLGAAVPWVNSLPSAIGRIGYAPGTPARDAAELLELLANVAFYIKRGDADQAASAAFFAGMLWQTRRDDDDAATGRRVRGGGRKGAGLRVLDDQAHVQWLLADNMLKREGIVSERKRARLIAKQFAKPFNTVRGAIRNRRKKP